MRLPAGKTLRVTVGRYADPRAWVMVHACMTGMIGDGTLKPGDRIGAAVVAEALGTSRQTTRKAFGKLCQAGILEKRQNGYFYVAETSESCE
jgi:DNA-binding GntR family transcriptional regulator